MSFSYPNSDNAASNSLWTPSASSDRYYCINSYPGTPDYIYAFVPASPVSYFTGMETIPVLPDSATLRIYLMADTSPFVTLDGFSLIDGASTVIASAEFLGIAINDSAHSIVIPLTINPVTVIGASTKLQLDFIPMDTTGITIYGIQVEWSASTPPPSTTNAGAFLALLANWPN